ncbi:MAG: transglutaminase-like domain-containing protein [Galbitalea sp.]
MTETATAPARPRIAQQSWIDIAVLSVLSILALLGFETSFGGTGFLVAGIGGLVIGILAGIVTYRFGLGGALTALAAIAAYFLLGTPLAVPSQGIGVVIPTLQSLGSLATGAVYGWADVLTLSTPIGAPVYIGAVPYVSGWVVGLVFTTLAVRWLARRPRTAWRYAIALIAPVALYVIGILIGTEEPFLASVRGITFAALTLVWLGWRRTANQSASSAANRALIQRKLLGTVIVVAVAALVAGGVGAFVPASSYARFVLRDKITPPFNPLDYPSPLAGFRHYTKTDVATKLFTVTGLKPGDRIRIATMDSYTGQLWNVVGSDVTRDGSGSFDLAGSELPTPPSPVATTTRTIHIAVDGYSDVWIPVVGEPEEISLGGTATGDDLHYNATTDTAALTGVDGGVSAGAQFTIKALVPKKTPSAAELEKLGPARVPLPAVDSLDVIAVQAQQHAGHGTSAYDKLASLSKYLHDNGYLSHGTTASPSPAGHGANRMIQMFPPNGTLVGDAEQYASAFALEARALGYPARVVMGFKPTIKSGQSSVTVVGKNVTAWDEVDFAKVGWVTFDPTPTQTGKPPQTPPPPVSQTVTQSRQPNRANQPQNDILSPVAIKKPKPKSSGFSIPGWVYTTTGIIAIPFAVYFIPLLIVAGVKRRRWRRRRTSGRGDEQVAGAWDELTDSYAELGFQVPRGLTRLNAAKAVQRQVSATRDPALPSLVEFAATTDEAVFSGEDIPQTTVEAAWSIAAKEISVAKDSVPRWRRWLARFRVRSKRGLPSALTSIDTTAVTDRVKELVNR